MSHKKEREERGNHNCFSYLSFGTFSLQVLGFGIAFLDPGFDFCKRFPRERAECRAVVFSLKHNF